VLVQLSAISTLVTFYFQQPALQMLMAMVQLL
jgi:hypothetical protein